MYRGPLRRAQISFAAMWAGESAFMVSLAVVAFADGGVAAVGAVTAGRMATAALLAPFLATLADRVRRERVLTCIGLVRAAMLGVRRGGDGDRRPGGGDVRLRDRRHGRRGALPAGALGARCPRWPTPRRT